MQLFSSQLQVTVVGEADELGGQLPLAQQAGESSVQLFSSQLQVPVVGGADEPPAPETGA